MTGLLSFDELKAKTGSGEIDTVVACFADMQGRLMEQLFHAAHFRERMGRNPLLQLSAGD